MQIEFLLGKAKTGKSTHIYNRIKEDIDKGKNDILFVPSQKRLITEEKYIKELNLSGIIGVNVTTISTFVLDKLKEYNLNYESNKLTKLDKKILLAKTITENKDIFSIFSGVIKKQGFIDNLYAYIDIFQKENINVSELENISLTDKLLENKLKEITKVYLKYIQNINNCFPNSIDEIEIFIRNILPKCNFKNTNIFFDGYNNFTNNELLFIEHLIKSGANVTISLTTDITSTTDIQSENTSQIFEVSNSTYMKLLKICNKNNICVDSNIFLENRLESKEDIKYLADNIFGNINLNRKKLKEEDINIYLKKNIYEEITYIANDIASKIRGGNRYNDFAIYTTNVESYKSVVQRIFYEYKIPYYIDTKKKIENSNIVSYIKKYIDILSYGITYEKALDILKLGLNEVLFEEISELENYIVEFNLNKYSLNKKLELNNNKISEHIYDLDSLNVIREKILNIFKLENTLNNVSDIINTIYNHLIENNVLKNYDAGNKIKSNSMENTFFEEQVWENVISIFESISNIYKDEELSILEFSNIFKIALSECYIKSIPPTIDTVRFLDINVSKTNEHKFTYFVSVNENIFPKEVDEDIFFSDFELEKLSNKNIEFKENSISKINMGLFNIYEAISNTIECLSLSILSSDTLGKSLRPSNLITLIKQIFEIDVIGDITKTDNISYNVFSKEQMFEELVLSLKESGGQKELTLKQASLIRYFEEDEKYNEILNYTKCDSNLNKDSINILYGNILNTSVSKLELFKKCPFSYFMQYTLNINPNVEYEITSLDTGTFMHDVLDKFSKYLFKSGLLWHQILIDGKIVEDKYLDVLYNIIEDDLNIILKRHKDNIKFVILKQKLVNTMKNVILIIAKSFNQSEFIPLGYEIEFKEGGVYAPIEVKIDEKHYMKIIGKIDRVDILEQEDISYLRVVDYKSSSRTLDLDDVREGISLQLLTYLNALIKNLEEKGQKVIPAACVYFNLSDKFVNLMEYTDDDEKLKSEMIKRLRLKGIYLNDIKILEKMDKKISDNNERMIDVSKTSLNRSTKKVLDEKEFINLSNEIAETLKNIGNEILQGVVKIEPNKKANHCKYCKYMSICRKNSCM